MYLRALHLQNFRNTKKISYEFSKETTAIIGPNASGKSNILEAIYLLSIGKSVKAEKDEELVHFEKEDARIEGVTDDNVKLTLSIIKNQYSKVTKTFFVNGVKRRRVDFIGNLRSVLFNPEDIELIIDSPSIRREYINNVLSQVSSEYRRRLARYEHALKSRNKVLYLIREGGHSADSMSSLQASSGQARGSDLEIWDRILVESGEKLVETREDFFTELNKLNVQFPNIRWQYLPRPISQEKLDENRARDIDAAQTLSGPHRDDFVFFDTSRNLHVYGSRGEQRIAVLALKLVELSFIEEVTGQLPVLLLDDIFSELDEGHRKIVLELLGRQQTILTSTEQDYVIRGKRNNIDVINLS